MTGRKWHWRARSSALFMFQMIPNDVEFQVILSTSVLPLAELLGIRPDLMKARKFVYFHDNQLVFPSKQSNERDFQYGYNEILTCLAADKVLFNSQYNKKSFLKNIKHHLKLQPDHQYYEDLDKIIELKCVVVFYPLDIKYINEHIGDCKKDNVLHIVWPHRWEFDKDPAMMCRVITKLHENGCQFKISVLGESYNRMTNIWEDLKKTLGDKLVHSQFIKSYPLYYKTLASADVVLSTAIHEFFGAAVMEAVYCGCIPVVPNRLSYIELFKGHIDEMYDTEEELYVLLKKLSNMKKNKELDKNYTHLALPFSSDTWFRNVANILEVE